MTRLYTLSILVLLTVCGLHAQTEVRVTDTDLASGQTINWTNDNVYILDGLVYLDSLATLNIEAGTVIKGASDITTGDNTSALIITRGSQIFAEGTADEPIIFTAEEDDLSDPADFTSADRGEWGGLIILGRATVATTGGIDNIEGIDPMETRGQFGGNDDADNSGVLRYVSVRHGGSVLADGDEINGITFGGVGSGTEVDYVEVFANDDDGIEFFGGTVDVKHATVAFCKDDGFDWDLGWRGRGQFWFVIQEPNTTTGHAGEFDGASPDEFAPASNPTVYNATFIGIGNGATANGGDAAENPVKAILMRDNTAGKFYNSVFTGYNGVAVAIEDRDDTTIDAYTQFQNGELDFVGNIFSDFQGGTTAADLFIAIDQGETNVASSSAEIAAAFATDNTIGVPGIAGISRTPDNMLDPRINAGGIALGGGTPSDDPYFTLVTYRGAFGNSFNWLSGWTALSSMNYLGDEVTPINNEDCIVVRDQDLEGGQTYNWGGGNCYTLDGLVYLEADATLNIAAGTVIRALNANDVTTGDNTSALIIARDATINATGTAAEPIIFTAAEDDLDDAEDFTAADRGEWGGLIILGNATLATTGGVDNIEGIDANEARAAFGGTDDADDSGVLNYVSIRHGGAVLSDGDEINGLTLGGVGSGTEIDYVEVFANSDDGIEFFGGTVSVSHATVAYCGDDGFDWDLGWRGTGQYWFSIQAPNTSTGHAGEFDGASPDDFAPFAKPTIYNATFVGIGANSVATGGDAAENPVKAILMRDNTGGEIYNSIITDFNGVAVAIEDRTDTDVDAFGRLQAGDLVFANNFFHSFAAGNTAADVFIAIDQSENVVPASSATVAANFLAAGNLVANPVLNNVLRDGDGNGLDPRPNDFGPASFGAPAPVDTDAFETVSYYGAFAPGNGRRNRAWTDEWTALSVAEGIDFDFTSGVGQVTEGGLLLDAPVPNPASNLTRINFELNQASEVELTVLDVTGRPVGFVTGRYGAGEQSETLDVSGLANGTYVVVLRAAGSRVVQKMVVSH